MDRRELKRWNSLVASYQKMREQRDHLQGDLIACRGVLREVRQEVAQLQREIQRRDARYRQLREKFKQLQAAVRMAAEKKPSLKAPGSVPAWIKPNLHTPAKPPGRKAGHAPAHRPMPAVIDEHIYVPVSRDASGKVSCPQCRAQLSQVKKHKRIVEDLVPAQRVVRCYHTISGYCPMCRRIVETRAPEQPPAPPGVDLPQSQLGLGALVTAALLRVEYRLPFRQITELLGDLTRLSLSSGGIARQMQKLAAWLELTYERIKVLIRASPVVHADETGWRIRGHNGWLWAVLTGHHTLFHASPGRGRKVLEELLGPSYSGTLVSDFYGVYRRFGCGQKQKCLAHLLRNLKETAQAHRAFARGSFYPRCKAVVQALLELKKNKPQMAADQYEKQGRELEARLTALGRGRFQEPQAKRLAARLRNHAGTLTVFLWDDQVPPTNNAAERALRPAVIARKISGGSRSAAGASATAILLSILRTAHQQNQPLVETLSALLQAHWAGTNPALLVDTFANAA